jgi:hypothetical protein
MSLIPPTIWNRWRFPNREMMRSVIKSTNIQLLVKDTLHFLLKLSMWSKRRVTLFWYCSGRNFPYVISKITVRNNMCTHCTHATPRSPSGPSSGLHHKISCTSVNLYIFCEISYNILLVTIFVKCGRPSQQLSSHKLFFSFCILTQSFKNDSY